MWDIIGHQKQIQYLQKTIESGKINHAYIFSGPAHLGKKSVAESFLFNLLCVSETDKRPCGRCKNCAQIKKNIHPDIYWLVPEAGKKNISIKQVRTLTEKLNKKSLTNSYKVATIKQAHELTLAAANALLKTLEEPSPKTIIILLVENLENIPSTITSRCQIIRFRPVNPKDIEQYLKSKNCSQASEITKLSQGLPGKAINFFKKPNQLKKYKEQIEVITELLEDQNLNKKIKITEKLTRSKTLSKDLPELINLGSTYLRDCLLSNHNLNQYATTNTKNSFNIKQIKSKIKILDQAKSLLQQNVQPKLILENIILNQKYEK